MAGRPVEGERYNAITQKLFEIGRQLNCGYPFDPVHLDKFLQLAVEGKFDLDTPPDAIRNIFWQEVYSRLDLLDEYFSVQCNAVIFADPKLWVIPVLRGVTMNKVVAGFKRLGVKIWVYADDLDAVVTVNDRDPMNGSYFVQVRKSIQSDEDTKNQSAAMRKESCCNDITLLERLLLGFGYFLTNGKHLDTKSSTLCSGSRHKSVQQDDYDSEVPYVSFDRNVPGMNVSLFFRDFCDSYRRARSVRVV